MAAADPLDVVALSRGTFDEVVVLAPAVTLWGACVAGTLVTCTIPSEMSGTIVVGGGNTEVRNLTVSGQRPGVWANGGARSVRIQDVVIRDTVMIGIAAANGGQVSCSNVAVRDTAPRGDGLFGRGLSAQAGSQVDVTRAVFEGNRDNGVAAMSEGTTVVLNDVAVRGTLGEVASRAEGMGMIAREDARMELHRCVSEANTSAGVYLTGSGTSMLLEDVVVRDTLARELDGNYGHGLDLDMGATCTLTRGLIEGNRTVGVFIDGTDTSLEMTDVVVRDTRLRDTDGKLGTGLQVSTGGACLATRAVLARNGYDGIVALGAGTTLTLTDVSVLDGRGDDMGVGGMGLVVGEGTSCSVSRASFEGNRLAGVLAKNPGSTVTLTDVSFLDTLSEERSRILGCGLIALDGVEVEVTRAAFERNRESAIYASWDGTLVTMTDVLVSETLERACAVDTCEGWGAGTGVLVLAGAHVDISRFVITRSVLCGVQLVYGEDEPGEPHPTAGTMDLHDGVISHNAVGANVQTEGFDVERLMDGVMYIDNGTNLDMSELPVPELVTGL